MKLANLLLESFPESPRDGGSLGFIEGHLGVFEDSLRVRCSPSLNTQSCNRRHLCSTFRFENMHSPKKTVLFQKKNIMQLFIADAIVFSKKNKKKILTPKT